MHLAHQFLVEVLRVGCSDNMYLYMLSSNLKACKDTLLLLGYNGEALYTDFSTEPAKYMMVEDVGPLSLSLTRSLHTPSRPLFPSIACWAVDDAFSKLCRLVHLLLSLSWVIGQEPSFVQSWNLHGPIWPIPPRSASNTMNIEGESHPTIYNGHILPQLVPQKVVAVSTTPPLPCEHWRWYDEQLAPFSIIINGCISTCEWK